MAPAAHLTMSSALRWDASSAFTSEFPSSSAASDAAAVPCACLHNHFVSRAEHAGAEWARARTSSFWTCTNGRVVSDSICARPAAATSGSVLNGSQRGRYCTVWAPQMSAARPIVREAWRRRTEREEVDEVGAGHGRLADHLHRRLGFGDVLRGHSSAWVRRVKALGRPTASSGVSTGRL